MNNELNEIAQRNIVRNGPMLDGIRLWSTAMGTLFALSLSGVVLNLDKLNSLPAAVRAGIPWYFISMFFALFGCMYAYTACVDQRGSAEVASIASKYDALDENTLKLLKGHMSKYHLHFTFGAAVGLTGTAFSLWILIIEIWCLGLK